MRQSLIGRLNLLIKRFSLVSVLFVAAVALTFSFAAYRNAMDGIGRESVLWASHLKDFKVLSGRETDRAGTSYAEFADGVLRVNDGEKSREINRQSLPENVMIFSPDGNSFNGVYSVKEGLAKIGGYVGFVRKFSVGSSYWYVFVGRRFSDIFLSHVPFLFVLAVVSFMYAWTIRIFLVKTKDSLKKDIDVLTSLVETFADSGEVPVLSGTESREIRSLAKILYDVSAKMKEEQAEAMQKAGTDGLTGLANKAAFEEKIESRILQGRVFSLIFMDLNGFKPINDKLGHDRGDEVLKEVAAKLRRVFRECDFISRWGGDEFAVLFEGDAEKLYDGIKERVIRALDEIDADGMKVSAAVGYAVWPVDGRTAEQLFKTADERMYADKIVSKSR